MRVCGNRRRHIGPDGADVDAFVNRFKQPRECGGTGLHVIIAD
jgi:hypothetical protein